MNRETQRPPQVSELAPLRLPLTGSHLIEASAGTGKTYTIAMLYVRLVLGHGGQAALTPPEILVVTFTEAATQELRDRIRSRLTEAAQYFRQTAAAVGDRPDEPDDLLWQLRADYPVDAWPACAHRLELAAEWMDEAAIATIHGWCNRMLREHAFDSQSDFQQTLETDQTELHAEVVRDYWRNFYYPLGLEESRLVHGCWATPQDLQQVISKLLDHVDQLAGAATAAEPAIGLPRLLAEKKRQLTALKHPWPQWIAELRQLYDEARSRDLFHKRLLQANHVNNWLDKLAIWATEPSIDTVDIGKGWQRLTPAGMAEAWKDGQPPAHPAFAAIAKLPSALADLPQPRIDLLLHATHWIANELERIRQRSARIGFDDLLIQLERALTTAAPATDTAPPDGPNRLATVIRQQFPVALIDEFQDTDPIQYRIFEAIYSPEQHRQDSALILIGDPKQAIYAFRGADIHTYLQARSAVDQRLYTLATNYRSTRAMVGAVNHCFELAEQQLDTAAFLFRPAQGGHNPVPFFSVKAQGRQDEFQVAGKTLPALQWVVAENEANQAFSRHDYLATLADICADQMVAWLNLGSCGQAGFVAADAAQTPTPTRALCPGDMAVLVNNRKEADHIRRALLQRGVRSVYLSDKETVYATPQAQEVQRWLAACAEPDNANLLRVALSTHTLGLTLAELDALNHDEQAWEARVVQFKAYRELWQRNGVLPLLRRILFDFGCGERLLDQDGRPPARDQQDGHSGERRMTDILHLAELLQQASASLEGEHALLRFLTEQMSAPDSEQEDKRLRLESDAALVQVITIHKSKGLEYPLVFLPFICLVRATKNTDLPLQWHDEQGRPQLALQADATALALADCERLAEDVRKLYVALTRARYLTWLGLASVKDEATSALDYLLQLKPDQADPSMAVQTDLLQQISAIVANAPADTMQVQAVSLKASSTEQHQQISHYRAPASTGQRSTARRLERAVREHWWIGSYSALRLGSQDKQSSQINQANHWEDTAQADTLLESLHQLPPDDFVRAYSHRTTAPMHSFHRGAEAGTFLHELLEWAARVGFAQALAQPAELREMIARRCQVRGWDGWIDPLQDWLQQLLQRDLSVGSGAEKTTLQLAQLKTVKAEMEFWLPAHQVDLHRLDALVCRSTLAGQPRPALDTPLLNGMLKGFMDLLFEHQGRYYVADYKSNWLGASDAHYSRAQMEQAILSHRYDLQYVIYLFALHRLLRSRLPDYDFDRHVGGAVYLFLRGINADTAGVHFERPPATLMAELDALFDGSEARP
ncbi:MAG: exodeoxyribonuclease V subunit beta [Sterolibacterium sp.]|nr:exodeoxyribonuclease V subunit beta [Sterolibacterium sp.]